MESENMRIRIINADWTPRQIQELINNYINMMQIELDRCIESIHIIDNYYLAIINGNPPDQCVKDDPIPKYQNISKITIQGVP